MYALVVLPECFPCSVHHGGFPPREWLATKGLLTHAQVDFMSDQNGISDFTTKSTIVVSSIDQRVISI